MKNTLHYFLLLLFAGLMLAACDDDDEESELVIPTTYDGSNFNANTTTEAAVRTQMAALEDAADGGRTQGVIVAFSELDRLYIQGSPSIQSITTDYYDSRLTGTQGWLNQLANASGGTYTPGPPNGGEGGVYGNYLFDENGLELEQVMEKGLFGAAMYNHAVALTQGEITAATVDQMVSIFGAHPDFPNTNNSSTADNPDQFLANYAARRDKNDGEGLYTQIRDAFIALQAAVNAGPAFSSERDGALQDVFAAWERINAATVINYCHQTIDGLSATNPTENQVGSAMHAYAEGVGFLHGWRTLNSPYRTITDGEIDQILELMNAPYNTPPTSYLFATDPVNQLPQLTQVIEQLQAIYNFTDQEIEDFKFNWVTDQGR